MIDIIVSTCNSKIEKCLFSIAMQTMKDKINVYVVDDCSDFKYDDVIEKFSKIININLIRLECRKGLGYAKQVGLDNSFGDYVFFLDADDTLYDCFSIENLYVCQKVKKCLVFSYYLSENKDGLLKKYTDEGSLYGKLFCRIVIKKNNIKFNYLNRFSDLSFCLLYNTSGIEKVFSDSISYVFSHGKNSLFCNEDVLLLDYCEEFVDNILWYIRNSEERKFSKRTMSKIIFNYLVILYGIYLDNFYDFDSDIVLKCSKKIYDYFKVYRYYLEWQIRDEVFKSINKKVIPDVSIDDFFEKIESYDLNNFVIPNDLISIIIPIYNKEKFLSKTIDSILNQNYKNFELLLIDDCSTDNSYNICKKYVESDSRIKLFKNDVNSGVSKTRNLGLEKACGKYICFVDADDSVKPEIYEFLHEYMAKYDLDFVQCMEVGSKKNIEGNVEFVNGNTEILCRYLVEDKISDTVWSKMFKKDVLKNVRFNVDFRKHEDTLFVFEVVKNCNKICLLRKELYFYHKSKNSLSNVLHFSSELNLLKILDIVEEHMNENYSDLIMLFYWYKLAKVLYFFYILKKIKILDDDKKVFKKILDDLSKFVKNASDIDYENIKKYNYITKLIREYRLKIK